MSSELAEHSTLILDGTKIAWYADRVAAWKRGERIAPITVDMALVQSCNYACEYCYMKLQENHSPGTITKAVIDGFLEDCAEIGVKGVSLVSDGESSISPVFRHTIVRGSELGLSMACASNGLLLKRDWLEEILPHLTYLRVNISAGEKNRYNEIMGAKRNWFEQVCDNIRVMMEIKHRDKLPVTIGMQMVLMPQYADQIIPLSKLAVELKPDYLVIKHCSDNEDGDLGVDYSGYEALYGLLHEAEAMSTLQTQIVAKWSKIKAEGKRSYSRCYGPPFLIQMSGTGLVAPCGMLFNDRYKDQFHIGNICETRFKDIWKSERYWEVMNHLASPAFDAQTMCGTLCLQHKVNETLDGVQKGVIDLIVPSGTPQHLAFV